MIPNITPYIPKIAAITMNRNLIKRAETAIAKEGVAKLAIAVIETMMTIAGETIPACTAAWPMTSAPTIEMADPTALGILTPASRKISNVISIMTASTKAGNGTDSR